MENGNGKGGFHSRFFFLPDLPAAPPSGRSNDGVGDTHRFQLLQPVLHCGRVRLLSLGQAGNPGDLCTGRAPPGSEIPARSPKLSFLLFRLLCSLSRRSVRVAPGREGERTCRHPQPTPRNLNLALAPPASLILRR